tara:strand:- start:271 stop:1107 length:837 start_codon:yes stop_codon:yes gene_type:complete
LEILKTIKELKSKLILIDGSLGFVPTMGALHKGHLSLLKSARKENEILVASLFLNPKQFSPDEDFHNYPRNIEKDISIFSDSGVDFVFMPDEDQVYPKGFSTFINNLEGGVFEGEFRDRHFEGVLTVVAKLINIVNPKRIYLGEKDAQQLFLIKKMLEDLNFDVIVRPVETIRESNGLACSSRNSYFSRKEFVDAGNIYQSLLKVCTLWKEGENDSSRLKQEFQKNLEKLDDMEIQYVEIVDPDTFKIINSLKNIKKSILIVAVIFKGIRLIDNIILD